MQGSSEKRRREIVLKVLADHDWRLVEDQEQFVAEICAEICQRDIRDGKQEQSDIQRAAMRHYCVVLHAACAGSNTPRQQRAFTELWNYLFSIALYKTHDTQLAQDLTQQSLVKIWKCLAQCKDSASFLGWVRMILINEVNDWFRKNKYTTLDPIGDIDETELNRVSLKPKGAGTDQVENDDLHQQLLNVIEKCLKDLRQQAIIIESFLNERGYKEIAEMLGLTIGNVHVLRHRALQALRKCRVFLESLGDYFK